jgi:Retrotransposon gag protein
MSTKLEIPVLSGVLDASTVNAWLNLCQDSFEVHAAVNSSTLKPTIQIVLAGIKMEASAAKSWWNENRDELKALTTWDEFAKKVKDRFVPANWKMDALAHFYGISQGSLGFMDFATRLQEARNTLSSGGTGFTISDSVFKNHLLFFSHPILCLRMRSIPSFSYASTRVDALIALMSSTWDSMVAERVIRHPLSATSSVVLKPTKMFIPLTDKEREALRLAGGCYRCRRTPSSPGWIKHGARDCPGDETNGITPAPVRPVAAVIGEDDDDSDGEFITAVMPSCVLGNGSFSEGEEEANGWDC